MQKIPLYILAGGKSSRFGSDKARAPIGGVPLIRHVAEMLKPAASYMTVIADVRGKYDDLALTTIGDDVYGLGPLGGLKTALRHCGEGWLLLASCDIVAFDPAWIGMLQDVARAGVRAVAFKPEKWQPIPALYHTSLAPIVEKQIAEGTLALWKLLDAADAVKVPAPPGWNAFRQANTPQELTGERADDKNSPSS